MNRVKITAIRQTVYTDLMAKYENPIEQLLRRLDEEPHECDD